jgi:hypothetical protein
MPPTPEELFCAALYLLTDGKAMMVMTMAQLLDITFTQAETLAVACAKHEWLVYNAFTVALREAGVTVARKALEASKAAKATTGDRRSSRRRARGLSRPSSSRRK